MYRKHDYRHYQNMYIVRYPQRPTEPKYFRGTIEPVFKLLEIKPLDPRKPTQFLVIDEMKWANIALIDVVEKSIEDLKRHGAQLLNREYVYKDEIDAKIQLAYVCSKFLIEPEQVYEATEGYLTPQAYKKLVSMFYEDFPEKYI